jgi:hypothetical protein
MNDDSARLDKIARVLSKRSGGTTSSGAPIFYGIDRGAKALLLRYADELACAALEGAQLLAQHRGDGKHITLADMQLILGSLLVVVVPLFDSLLKLFVICIQSMP